MQTWMEENEIETTHIASFMAGAAATAALSYYVRDLAPLVIAAGAVAVSYGDDLRVYDFSHKNCAAFGAMTVGVMACGYTLLRTLRSSNAPNFWDQLTGWIAPGAGALLGTAALFRTFDPNNMGYINTWSEDMEKSRKMAIVAAVTLSLAAVGRPTFVSAGSMLVTYLNGNREQDLNGNREQEMTASALAAVIVGTLMYCDIVGGTSGKLERISTNILRIGVGLLALWQLESAIAERD